MANLPKAKRLIEPFTGSGAVFINSDYKHYILAERNKDLVYVYHHLQQEGVHFIEDSAKYFSEKNNHKEKYYLLREQFNQSKQPRKRALLFIYLNRHGYNGLCRYNQTGIYNVPFGRYSKPYFPYEEMLAFFHKSKNAIFIENDFRLTFALAKPGDVIYCDPPYVSLSASANFSKYTPQGFSDQDQQDLAQLAKKCSENKITVIVSNHDNLLTREYYKDAEIISFPVTRNISCNPLNRKAVQELIAVFR